MGCGTSFFCRTCRTEFFLGYGSYGTWAPHNDLSTYQAWAATHGAKHATLRKNQNLLKVLQEHGDHDHFSMVDDVNTEVVDGNLCGYAGYMDSLPYYTIIEAYKDWEYVNLWEVI